MFIAVVSSKNAQTHSYTQTCEKSKEWVKVRHVIRESIRFNGSEESHNA